MSDFRNDCVLNNADGTAGLQRMIRVSDCADQAELNPDCATGHQVEKCGATREQVD